MEQIDSYRNLFPVAGTCTFLNHAAVSSPSTRVVQAVHSLLEETSVCGIRCYSGWMDCIRKVRGQFAELIHADPDEIAFVGNTSEGLSLIAGGLNWNPGDSVLVPRTDFPSNVYPWLNQIRSGVKIVFYEKRKGQFTVEDVEKALVPRTRLLAVSSVDFMSGFSCDLQALGDLCRRKGILFCVDAIQSLGILPMDVKQYGIHFLSAGSHKWLLGTMGIGGLFIAEEAISQVHPLRVGWKSVQDEDNYYRLVLDLKANALGFEAGTMNLVGIVALGASLELLREVGIQNVRSRVFALIDRLHEGLEERGLRVASSMKRGERSGIISFMPSKNPEELFRFFFKKNVMVALRGGAIRVSPHFYNNFGDVDAFFSVLDEFEHQIGG